MPNFTFYRSVDDDGGAKGDQIADGSIDALLPPITGAMRLDGATILRKVWIECDEDVDMLYGVANDGLFQAYAFLSANDDDHIADLTGNERNIAALKVTANTDTTITVEADSDTGVVAADDYITIGTEISQVDSVADNGDGTWTVTLKGSITAGDNAYAGQWMAVQFRQAVTAGTAIPMWVKVVIPPLANSQEAYNTIPVICSA